MTLSDGNNIDHWRLFKPIRRMHDRFFKMEIFVIDCILLNIGKRIRQNRSAHRAEIEYLDFLTGMPQRSNAIIWEKTKVNIEIEKNGELPIRTKCSVVPNEQSFKGYEFVVYMYGTLADITRFNFGVNDNLDPLTRFHENYKELNGWIDGLPKSRDFEPITHIYEEFDSGLQVDNQHYYEESTGADDFNQNGFAQNPYYNDQLDLDQQPPEFWDNI